MLVRVVLDQPANVAYTNLDHISGHVLLRTPKSENVNSVVVKLEGESRTRLMIPPGPNGERAKPVVEYHKLLYKVQMVFPDAHVADGRTAATLAMSSRTAYGLPAGEHVYPFAFKIPFNNSCAANSLHQPMLVGRELARPATRHVKKTLPPTLSGFPGEADIRYYVKCTVNRHGFLKENARTQTYFNFIGIENPRPPLTGAESFARQKHQFDGFPGPMNESAKEKMKVLFGKKSHGTPNSPNVAGGLPLVSIDARLPEPAILTCNHDIPLRLMFKKLGQVSDQVFMNSLQISLISHTKIRAHELYRTETNSWVICSISNANTPLGSPSDAAEAEHVLDDRSWRGPNHTLPNTVAPSFETCNIERAYQLDIHIGLSYGNKDAKVRIGEWRIVPQQVVLPLRMDCEVYSGIAPPAEVIARMEEAQAGNLPPRKPSKTTTNPLHDKLRYEGRMDPDFGLSQIPTTPTEGSASGWLTPPIAGSSAVPRHDEAPPPSYEDAVADRSGPVTAPRPSYAPPAQAEDPLLGGDEKRGWH